MRGRIRTGINGGHMARRPLTHRGTPHQRNKEVSCPAPPTKTSETNRDQNAEADTAQTNVNYRNHP